MAASRIRGLRVDDATWDTWERVAGERGISLSALIRDAVNAAIGAPVVTLASKLRAGLEGMSGITLAVDLDPEEYGAAPGRAARGKRAGPCEHRNPPGVYCKRCD